MALETQPEPLIPIGTRGSSFMKHVETKLWGKLDIIAKLSPFSRVWRYITKFQENLQVTGVMMVTQGETKNRNFLR